MVKEASDDELTINWRYFSLEQVNSQQADGWKIWEQAADFTSRSLNAFIAAEAARAEGEDAFNSFHYALLRARHEEKRDIASKDVLCEVAIAAGLDVNRFRSNLEDRRLLDKLASDHNFATASLNIFGTPTLVFEGQQAVFLKMTPPPPEEALEMFHDVRRMAVWRPTIREFKRP